MQAPHSPRPPRITFARSPTRWRLVVTAISNRPGQVDARAPGGCPTCAHFLGEKLALSTHVVCRRGPRRQLQANLRHGCAFWIREQGAGRRHSGSAHPLPVAGRQSRQRLSRGGVERWGAGGVQSKPSIHEGIGGHAYNEVDRRISRGTTARMGACRRAYMPDLLDGRTLTQPCEARLSAVPTREGPLTGSTKRCRLMF